MRLSGPTVAFRGYVRAVPDDWTVLILSGGSSSRMGSDKAGVELEGRRLLDWLVDSIPGEIPCVLVGPDPVRTSRPVTVTREEPAGGGPVAGISAGLRAVATSLVAIVAVDMPLAGPSLPRLVDLLAEADDNVDAVLPMDAGGRLQPLAGAYRADSLRAALERIGPATGRPVRDLVAQLSVSTVPGLPNSALTDVDTEDDLALLRRSLRDDVRGPENARKDGDMDEWAVAAAAALGIEQAVDVDLILDVAREAAHGVARPAAPITTFLLGCAVAGGQSPEEAAARLTLLAREWPSSE